MRYHVLSAFGIYFFRRRMVKMNSEVGWLCKS
ncbi:hypothetical protein AAZX31_14G178300 [Glycine max]